ncbi:MAG TPA: hypothetical protein VMU47_06665 [Caldimonas sp.]|nr:hypothetical protein [Caldimonas sp.]
MIALLVALVMAGMALVMPELRTGWWFLCLLGAFFLTAILQAIYE